MDKINVLLLQDEIKKTRFKILLKDPYFVLALSAILVNIPSVLITNISIIRFIASFTIAFETMVIKDQIRNLKNIEQQALKTSLQGTTTYKECKEEYKRYIEEVAKLIKKAGLASSKEIIVYIEMLMTSGYFSENHEHIYHNYQYEYIDMVEVAGARVLTGKSVCRHQSTFIVDVLNSLGYHASNMSVIATPYNPVKLAKTKHKRWNHSVLGIADQGEMYLFDPTSKTFCAKPTNIDFSEIESILVSEYISPKQNYLVMNPHLSDLNNGHERNFYQILSLRQAQITQEESDEVRRKITEVVKDNEQIEEQFYQEQEELRKKVASLYKELIPHQDTPIKKWTVRK